MVFREDSELQTRTANTPCKPISEMTRDDFRFYHIPIDSHSRRNLRGCASEEPRYIFKHVGFNKFEDRLTMVPESAVPADVPPDSWISAYFVDSNKHKLVADIAGFAENALPKGNAYQIEDNGGVPFVAYVDGESETVQSVSVFRVPASGYIDDEDWVDEFQQNRLFYQEQICLFESVAQAYLGFDSSANAHGNSILVRMKNDNEDDPESSEEYVYIGSEIYAFQLKRKDRISEYFSRMGNSRVPYPVAVSDTVMVFMLDAVSVPREEIMPWITDAVPLDDSYSIYYDRTSGQTDCPLKETPLAGHQVLCSGQF